MDAQNGTFVCILVGCGPVVQFTLVLITKLPVTQGFFGEGRFVVCQQKNRAAARLSHVNDLPFNGQSVKNEPYLLLRIKHGTRRFKPTVMVDRGSPPPQSSGLPRSEEIVSKTNRKNDG